MERYAEMMENILHQYDHEAAAEGCEALAAKWRENKTPLLELLQRHPLYDAERCAIILPEAELLAEPDAVQIGRYIRYVKGHAPALIDAETGEIKDDETAGRLEALCCNLVSIIGSLETGSALLTEAAAEAVNACLPEGTRKKAAAGQKVSRALRLLHVSLGLSEEHGTDDAGQLAKACDNCSCHRVDAVTVIGLHPLDYLTMSFGTTWRSCHTIDYNNLRNTEGEGYSGQYRSGTVSYMLDGASVVMYTCKTLDDARDFEAGKLTRCMMYIAPDGRSFVQSRVYPQRSDTDGGLIGSYRAIMQAVLAECLQEPSSWSVKKGTGAACEMLETVSGSTHYEDYLHFGTVTASRLQAADEAAPVRIRVGHAPLCAVCGVTHSDSDAICCGRHEAGHTCEYCSTRIRDTDDAQEIGGGWYCDYECAERDGWRWSDTENDYVNVDGDSVYYDDYHGDWFIERWESVHTEDGSHFVDHETAYDAGYAEDEESGEWYPQDDFCYCERCNRDLLIDSFWTNDAEYCDACTEELEEEQRAEAGETLRAAIVEAIEEAADVDAVTAPDIYDAVQAALEACGYHSRKLVKDYELRSMRQRIARTEELEQLAERLRVQMETMEREHEARVLELAELVRGTCAEAEADALQAELRTLRRQQEAPETTEAAA